MLGLQLRFVCVSVVQNVSYSLNSSPSCYRDDIRLTSLSSLIDVGLFMSLLVAGTTIHVGWSFGLRVFRTFQTEVYVEKMHE